MYGIKQRKIVLKKGVNSKKRKRIDKQAAEAFEEIEQAEKEGYEMVYLDETLFKTKTMKPVEYCRQRENYQLSQQALSHPCKALLMSISFQGGVEYW